MWDDVIISKKGGYDNKGCMATKCFEIDGDHSISENKVSYWATLEHIPIEIELVIFKDTKEGQMLANMIAQKESIHEIERYLFAIALKRIKPKSLIQKIEALCDKQFKKGKQAKIDELKQVLQIETY